MDTTTEVIMGKSIKREPSEPYQNEEDKGEELLLNKKTSILCFLCLQKCSKPGGGAGENGYYLDNEESTEVSIRSISRFLEVNLDNYESSSVVMMCGTCSYMCNTFSDLIRQLEVIRMRIEDKLELFNDVLMTSGPEPFQDSSSFDISMKGLRKSTRDKSFLKLRNMINESYPKLKLRQTTTETEISIPPSPSSSLIASEPGSSDLECVNPEEWISRILQELIISRHRYCCPFCKGAVPEQKIRSHLLLGHPEKYFLQKLNTNIQMDEETIQKFCCQNILNEVQTARHVLPGPKCASRKPGFRCQHCQSKFNDEDAFQYHFLVNHFSVLEEKLQKVDKNKGAGARDLEGNEKSPPKSTPKFTREQEADTDSDNSKHEAKSASSPSSKVFKIFSKFCKETIKKKQVPDRYRCTLCKNNSLQARNKIYNHLSYVHPESIFLEKKFPKVSDAYFKQCCAQVLNEESSNVVEDESLKPYQKGTVNYSCPFCPMNTLRRMTLKYHLVVEHYDNLGEKIVRLQENSPHFLDQSDDEDEINRKRKCSQEMAVNEEAEVKVKRFKTSPEDKPDDEIIDSSNAMQMISKICTKLTKLLRNENRTECCVCNITFPCVQQTKFMRRHVVNSHPEHFFSRAKSKLNLEEWAFNGRCKQILMEETKAANAKRSSNSSSTTSTTTLQLMCKLCNRKMSGGHDFRFHMVLEHYEVIEDKLLKSGEVSISMGNSEDNEDDQKIDDDDPTVEDSDSTDGSEVVKVRTRRSKSKSSKKKSEDKRSSSSKEKRMILDTCSKLTKKLLSKNRTACLICNTNLPSSPTLIRRHIIQFHPEKLFSRTESKLNLEEWQFKGRCKQMLIQQSKEAQRVKSSSSKTPQLLCGLCNEKKNCSSSFRFHVVFEHYKVIEDKLMRIGEVFKEDSDDDQSNHEIVIVQDTPGKLPSALAAHLGKRLVRKYYESSKEQQMIYDICWKLTKSIKTPDGNRVQCAICNVTFSSRNATLFRRHVVTSHPENFFPEGKVKLGLSDNQFKRMCKKAITKEMKSAENRKKSTTNYLCRMCDRKYRASHDFKQHIVHEHHKIIEEKIMTFGEEFGRDPENEDESSEEAYEIKIEHVTDSPEEEDVNEEDNSEEEEEDMSLEDKCYEKVEVDDQIKVKTEVDDNGEGNPDSFDVLNCEDEKHENGTEENDMKIVITSV